MTKVEVLAVLLHDGKWYEARSFRPIKSPFAAAGEWYEWTTGERRHICPVASIAALKVAAATPEVSIEIEPPNPD